MLESKTVFCSVVCRLIDLAPKYFEPSSFPEGEMRSALERYLSWRAQHEDDLESNQKAMEGTMSGKGVGVHN